MIPLLDLLLKGRSIAEVILEPVLAEGLSPKVVDVGARNGIWSLPPAYAKQAHLVGFEPNPVEFSKLQNHKTDADKALSKTGQNRSYFKDESYFPFALWDREEERELFVTRGPGATTLMGAVHPKMKNRYKARSNVNLASRKSIYDIDYHIEHSLKLACRPLDALLPADDKIDFLKLDVEGAELRVLKGANNLLNRHSVLFIQTEFQVFPYYEESPLLCDQHRFLADRGFVLLDIQLDHARLRRGEAMLPLHNDRAPLAAGDAFFCLDPDGGHPIDPLNLHRLAAISLAFNFSSWALSLLRDAALLTPRNIDEIEATIARRKISWRRGLVNRWNSVPDLVWNGLRYGIAALNRVRS